ncbi:MAG TPA: DUF3459 domain-containing protein, partial [Streptosporangiaceae bacterium]|nr:DUF3459 domain-containing protein [Streptosporangiaceae bacterium]
EEWGAASPFPYFTDHADPDLAEAVRQGRRSEFAAFGWEPSQIPDPQSQATFASAKLDWSEPAKNGHADLLRWYQDLIQLRRDHQDLTDPRFERTVTACDEAVGWITVQRGQVLVAVNLGSAEWTCPVDAGAGLLAASDPRIQLIDAGLVLPPDTVAIVACR